MSQPPQTAPDAPPIDLRPERFGRYVLLDRIDVGGMAEVFRGRMTGVEGFERMVALKRILPNIAADPDFVEMFVDEAKLAVQLQHANIAQIYELGKVDESHFIAMEYVSGVSLRMMWDRARARGRLLPIAMSCHILQKVCEGLDAAHRKRDGRTGEPLGLVHRDVSPQNILVSFEGEVKVIDFGIAKAANKVSKTQAGVLKGKFGYMSPEQVRGIELDHRSDVFACGVVLYELLVGDRLFLGESDFSTLEKVRNVDVPAPSRLNKNLSPELERIVMKALAKNRNQRYRWAGEMAEALQRYLFSTNQAFARTDLQRYMQQHYSADMTTEKERLEIYSGVDVHTDSGVIPQDPRVADEPETGTFAQLTSDLAAPVQSVGSMPAMRRPSSIKAPVPESDPEVTSPAHPAPDFGRPLPTWAAVLIGGLAAALVGVVATALFMSDVFRRSGDLTVTYEPSDATLHLDDRLVANRSPVELEALDTGTHVLRLSRDGFEESVRPVRVVAGETRTVSLRLSPREGEGVLEVRSDPPGLEIWIDGTTAEAETPHRFDTLPLGPRELSLRRADGALVHRTTVALAAGEPQTVDVDVAALPALLEVASRPAGGDLRVKGVLRGRTPTTLELDPGTVTIDIRKKGCKRWREKRKLEKGVIQVVEVTLDCS
ncbi:MAG: serine/threonine-protein kinase [Myxococcota bacterium]